MLAEIGRAVVVLALTAAPASARICPDVALVLAFDASSSIDADEFDFQLRATADAFRAPEVIGAIERSGTVAVAGVIWADGAAGIQVISWDFVSGPADGERLARRLEAEPRIVSGDTDLGNGLWAALDEMEAFTACPTRRIVNVSGDGRETLASRRRHSASVFGARKRANEMGVTVNGLAIETEDPGLSDYFGKQLIAGPGAFVFKVSDWESFAVAMRHKLVRELSPLDVSGVDAAGHRLSALGGVREPITPEAPRAGAS
jgi:hypothetical protein